MACTVDDAVDIIVLDTGSRTIKAGLASEKTPRVVFPNAYSRLPLGLLPTVCERRLYGDEAIADTRPGYDTHCPMHDRIIQNWNDMARIWFHTLYNQLHIQPEEHPILLTEPPLSPKPFREKLLECFFEEFNAPAVYLANQAVLSLYASGRLTGMVCDSGHHQSYTVPVYEGYAMPHTLTRPHALGGDAVTQYLIRLLNERGYTLTTRLDRDLVRRMKEEFCYVALNYEGEYVAMKGSSCLEKEYTLPDGRIIKIGEERFRCPELLFQPHFQGSEQPGLIEKLTSTIQNCDIDIQGQLYYHIVLSGGSTVFPGFTERIQKDLTAFVHPTVETRVIAPAERQFATWIGGSMFSSLSTFQAMWISKSEYDDYGPSIVHQKCF